MRFWRRIYTGFLKAIVLVTGLERKLGNVTTGVDATCHSLRLGLFHISGTKVNITPAVYLYLRLHRYSYSIRTWKVSDQNEIQVYDASEPDLDDRKDLWPLADLLSISFYAKMRGLIHSLPRSRPVDDSGWSSILSTPETCRRGSAFQLSERCSILQYWRQMNWIWTIGEMDTAIPKKKTQITIQTIQISSLPRRRRDLSRHFPSARILVLMQSPHLCSFTQVLRIPGYGPAGTKGKDARGCSPILLSIRSSLFWSTCNP